MKKQERYDILQAMGCVSCLLDGHPGEPCDIHHLVEGRKRLGDHATLPLCPWHHRGIPDTLSAKETERVKGPSLARNKREFVNKYGTERELLEFVNRAIEEFTNGSSR